MLSPREGFAQAREADNYEPTDATWIGTDNALATAIASVAGSTQLFPAAASYVAGQPAQPMFIHSDATFGEYTHYHHSRTWGPVVPADHVNPQPPGLMMTENPRMVVTESGRTRLVVTGTHGGSTDADMPELAPPTASIEDSDTTVTQAPNGSTSDEAESSAAEWPDGQLADVSPNATITDLGNSRDDADILIVLEGTTVAPADSELMRSREPSPSLTPVSSDASMTNTMAQPVPTGSPNTTIPATSPMQISISSGSVRNSENSNYSGQPMMSTPSVNESSPDGTMDSSTGPTLGMLDHSPTMPDEPTQPDGWTKLEKP